MGDEKNHLNRREFLSKTAYGMLTAGLYGISGERPVEQPQRGGERRYLDFPLLAT